MALYRSARWIGPAVFNDSATASVARVVSKSSVNEIGAGEADFARDTSSIIFPTRQTPTGKRFQFGLFRKIVRAQKIDIFSVDRKST